MQQEDTSGYGYNGCDSSPQKRCGSSAEIGYEPPEDADIRYDKNSQPDLEISNLLLCNVKLGHEVNTSRRYFYKDTPGSCWRGLTTDISGAQLQAQRSCWASAGC